MTIDDVEVKVKKFDRNKNIVIVNLKICNCLDIRGFVVRYATTKYSPVTAIWFVTPPSVKGRGGAYYWTIRFTDSALWELVEKKIIDVAKDHTNLL